MAKTKRRPRSDAPFAAPDWPATRPEMWPLAKIRRYENNPRTHPAAQIEQLAASMKSDGVTMPILVDEDGVIIAGHGRLLGAQANKFEEYPVVIARGWSEEQKRAARLKDNQIALLSGWDNELMRAELSALKLDGYDVGLLGFSSSELLQWTGDHDRRAADAVPPTVVDPIVQPGDLWVLDRHVLLCGDSTKREAVAQVLKGRGAVTVTDPPYGIDYEYREHDDNRINNADLVRSVFSNCPVGKVWTPGKMNLARELAVYPTAKVLTWHKKFAAAGNGLGGASTIEPVLVVGIKKAKLPDDYLAFPTDREPSPADAKKMLRDEHPCPKPVALFEHLLTCLTRPEDVAFDPFCGSASTMIAAELANRSFAGIEIDCAYVELSIMRWMAFTGKPAMLNGVPFDDVKRSRNKAKRRPQRTGASSRESNLHAASAK